MANYLDENGLETVWECITDTIAGYVDPKLELKAPTTHFHNSIEITDLTSKVNTLIDAKLGVITNGTY